MATDEQRPDNSPIPPTAVWCGLERYNEPEDAWERLEIEGVGRWWLPKERHPEALADELWEKGDLDHGTYRAVWAPKDKRRNLPSGLAFLLDENAEEEPAPGAAAPVELNPAEPDSPAPPPPVVRVVPNPPPPPTTAPRRVPTIPRRPVSRVVTSAPQVPVPPAPAAAAPGLPFVPRPDEMSPLAQFVAIQHIAEAERARNHQLQMNLIHLMVTTIETRASALIAGEQARADQTIEFLRNSTEAKRRADLQPLEQQLRELGEQVGRVQDDAAADAEEQIQNQLATLSQQPEGPQAIVGAIGAFLQSPAGELIAESLRGLIGGAPQKEPAPLVLDPAG